MKICIVNGSPKGKMSTTLYTLLYLEKLHPEHRFEVLNAGQTIKAMAKDFSKARKALEEAEMIVFSYPVYTFLAPSQLHYFVELMKENGVEVEGKIATQVTTSKHFYDVTAHRYVEEICGDLGLNYLRGLSADMNDILTDKGRKEARDWFDYTIDRAARRDFERPVVYGAYEAERYERHYEDAENEESEKMVAIVTSAALWDVNVTNMIEDFRAELGMKSKVVNVREYPFTGGCLGCFHCASTGKCIYKDGFDHYLRQEIQSADAIVYAFRIENHYAHHSMKMYDDRQFCNGHRTVAAGKPTAYLISGQYSREQNLRMLVESRSEVGENYLAGVVTDERAGKDSGNETARELKNVAMNLKYAVEKGMRGPQNFYGVGGMKIFRDLIWVMRGLMKADHKYYKEHGVYDFPQKEWKTIWMMKMVGWLMAMPGAKGKNFNKYVVAPYEKMLKEAEKEMMGSGAGAEEKKL